MFLLNAFNQSRELSTFVVAILFFVPFLGGIIWYSYKTRHGKSWRKGIVPKKMKFSQDNLLEVYLALGARLILINYKNSKGQSKFINEYFNRYFTSSNYDFGDSLIFSMRYPVKVETACDWLNMHLKDESRKSQVIYFLVGLALINENLHARELAFLADINNKLGLSASSFEQIIAIYRSYYASKEKERKKEINRSRKGNIENYYAVLGIPLKSDIKAIKKAYRSLAKIHHPDVFANASEAQQKMAKEKFILIQEAYEALINLHH